LNRKAPPQDYEFGFIDSWGHIRNVILMVDMIPQTKKSVASFIDITDHKKAVALLEESGNLYRTIFETTLAATIIIEEDTTISLVNSEFSKMSGYSREEWEGKKSWTEFVIPEDRERMRIYHHLRRVNCNAAPNNYEFGFIDNQGRIRNVILMVDMIPQTSKSVASFADITEHKLTVSRLQESENLYRTIFENTGTATMIVEEDMTISLANTEFETLSGAPKEYWENKRKWTELFSQKDLQKMIHYHQQRRIDPETSLQNYQCALIDKQGNKKVVLLAVAMIPGSKKSVISLTDITEQKRVEMALQKREQEVQKKSRNLEEMNSALKVLLKQRETDKLELEENVLTNVKDLILPYLVKLKASHLNSRDAAFVNILEANLMNITSPFFHSLSSNYINLTPKEIQVANLIKDGKTTKEIADIIGVCQGAISLHRDHIRKKMGLNNKKINLNTYLTSLA
jgi:PAS domain S-box-containing protein